LGFFGKELRMNWKPTLDPYCPTRIEMETIETPIVPQPRVGQFEVSRALKAARG
jgi:hypothetical protein